MAEVPIELARATLATLRAVGARPGGGAKKRRDPAAARRLDAHLRKLAAAGYARSGDGGRTYSLTAKGEQTLAELEASLAKPEAAA